MNKKYGIIAEDKSDIAVIKILIRKITGIDNISSKGIVGKGCGKMLSKCHRWARNLMLKGCNILLLVHDLDRKNKDELCRQLNSALLDCSIPSYVIIIPIEEIEAWLLSDSKAIMLAFKKNFCFKLPSNPETVVDPKGYLEKKIRAKYNKIYLNTVHNEKIAENISLMNLEKCSSFQALSNFVEVS